MKKLTFLVYHKEYEAFLKDIRSLGVVHIVEKQQGIAENPELQDNIRLSNRLSATLKQFQALKASSEEKTEAFPATVERGHQLLDEVEAIQTDKSKLLSQLQSYAKDEKQLETWGDFEPESIQKLHESGIRVDFYTCSERNYQEEWEELYNAVVINQLSSRVYFITISEKDDEPDIDAEQVKMPLYSLSEIKKRHKRTEELLRTNEQKLIDLAAKESGSLVLAIKTLHKNIELSKVFLSSEQVVGDKLMLLQGWIPVKNEREVSQYLENHYVYYEITNPVPEDNVPILFNNKGLFAWFEAISRLYMLPKYNELDLTPFLAPFFMVFFGLCLGDSGYGLFLFLAATIYRSVAKNISASMKPILSLIQTLAISTFFAGLLTGSFFGFSLYDLNWPVVEWMKENIYMDNNQMFKLSLILGGIQIMFAMVLKIVNKIIQFGFKYAISTLGWFILLFSIITAALFPSLLPMGGTFHLVIIGVTGAMIFFYNSPGKNIFLNIGLGLWDTYNMVTGLLGDILSYVRLFALGLSGGILAGVFNSLAAGMRPDNIIVGPIVMVIIFVAGHAINMFMNVLGAIVHPMRLTFVEFFKNAGYEGGGKEYKPFRN